MAKPLNRPPKLTYRGHDYTLVCRCPDCEDGELIFNGSVNAQGYGYHHTCDECGAVYYINYFRFPVDMSGCKEEYQPNF